MKKLPPIPWAGTIWPRFPGVHTPGLLAPAPQAEELDAADGDGQGGAGAMLDVLEEEEVLISGSETLQMIEPNFGKSETCRASGGGAGNQTDSSFREQSLTALEQPPSPRKADRRRRRSLQNRER